MRNINRRGFFGVVAGFFAAAKTSFGISPAASAIPPTCEGIYRYEVHFLTRDGRIVEPSLKVTEINEATNTIWLDSAVPADAAGRVIVMSPVRGSLDDIPYHQVDAVASFLGIERP